VLSPNTPAPNSCNAAFLAWLSASWIAAAAAIARALSIDVGSADKLVVGAVGAMMVGPLPLLPLPPPPLPPPPPHPAARAIESRIKHHPNGRRLLCEVLNCIANDL
jgi:hypothetical protein